MSRLSEHYIPPSAAPAAAGAFAAEVPLSKPLVTAKGEMSVLRLKVPAYSDIMELGEVDKVYVIEIDPVTNRPAKMETAVDRRAVVQWASRLTGLGEIEIGSLTMKDGLALEMAIRRIVGAAQKGN